jgi:type IV secretion system protein VirB7
MSRPILLAMAGSALLSACATPAAKPLPVCDGRHLRPANPYGSVLQPATPAAPVANVKPAGSAPITQDPAAGSDRASPQAPGAHGGCGS